MKRIKIIVLLLFVVFIGKAQQPLKVGDMVPDLRMKMFNYTIADSVSLSQFRGKILILDFWSVFCSNCIASFPELYDLQHEFQDELTILPVGFDVSIPMPIAKLYDRMKGTKLEIKMPTALQYPPREELLMKWFPFHGLPRYIWIDAKGVFRAASSKHEVTKENIENALRSDTWPHAQDTLTEPKKIPQQH